MWQGSGWSYLGRQHFRRRALSNLRNEIENYREAEGLRSGIVYALFEDSEGVLWIGSAAGLSWFENGRLQTVSSRDGLPSNQVFALVDDDYGRLWFTGYGGIASVEKSSLVEWAA